MKILNRNRISQTLALGLLGIVTMLSTGCMLTPGDGEVFHSRGSNIDVYGITTNPGDVVTIQARNPNGGAWVTLAVETTTAWPIHIFDTDYYSFDRNIVVPANLWAWDPAQGKFKTEIQSVLPSGAATLTFEGEFETYLWDYDINDPSGEADIWRDHGAGNQVTIYANNW